MSHPLIYFSRSRWNYVALTAVLCPAWQELIRLLVALYLLLAQSGQHKGLLSGNSLGT